VRQCSELRQAKATARWGVFFGGPVKGFSSPSDASYAIQIEECRELKDVFLQEALVLFFCFRLGSRIWITINNRDPCWSYSDRSIML
jgi:hypothetical protein